MIKLSKTGDIALKAMSYLAIRNETIQISTIAKDQGISVALLRKVVADLVSAGLIESIRGRNGGVKLAKDASKIHLYDIFFAVGEELGLTDCTKDIYCANKADCLTSDVLQNLQRGFNSLLKIQTLDKVIK